MDKVKTGILIRDMRIKQGYTQKELAERLNITNKAVSRWETGKSFPDIALLDVLANVLEISIEEIVIGELRKEDSSNIAVEEIVQEAKAQKQNKSIKIVTILIAIGCIFLLLLILYFAMALYVINGAIDVNNAESNLWIIILFALYILYRFGLPCIGIVVSLALLHIRRDKKRFAYLLLIISSIWLSGSILHILYIFI